MNKKICTEAYKLQCKSIKYVVNENKGAVTAIAVFSISYVFMAKDFSTVGTAIVTPSKDSFDVEIGKKIARARAEQEAYAKFKVMLMDYKDRLTMLSAKTQNTIDKMNMCIQHQKEYIKSF